MAIGAYTKTTWANSPATTSPVSAPNLQHIEDQVKDITDSALTIGTWTPTIIGSTTPGTQTYTVQTGAYIKIGKLVYINLLVAISAKDAGIAGDITIGGLPAVAEASPSLGALSVLAYTGITMSANYTQIGAGVSGGGSTIIIRQNGSAQTSSTIAVAGLAATSSFSIAGVYAAAS